MRLEHGLRHIRRGRLHQLLKDQACREPERGVVQTDQTVDVPFGAAVIPGTHFIFFENAAADIFGGENTAGVDKTSE